MVERRLAWGDRITDYRISEIDDEEVRLWQDELAFGDESHFLVLEVTSAQYNALFASAFTGADLLYGDSSHGTLWPLWKAATMGRFCDAVRSCVSSGGGGGAGGNPEKPVTPGLEGRNMLPDDYVCDADHAFGLARAIVEAIHAATTEFFEQIELATNPLELALEINDNIPIVSVASTAGEVLAWVQETIAEIYIAAWSDTTRDDIACDLMCLILEDCTLSYGDVFGLYVEGISGLPSLIDADFLEWMDWLFQITPGTNEATVKVAGLVGLIAMRFGGKFLSLFELGIYSFDMVVKLAADESSDEHGILCDECPELPFTATADLTGLTLPDFLSVIVGIFVSEMGINSGCDFGDPENKLAGVRLTSEGLQVNSYRVGYINRILGGHADSGDVAGVVDGRYEPDRTYKNLISQTYGQLPIGDAGLLWEGAYEILDEYINSPIYVDRYDCDGAVTLVEVKVTGRGDHPFEGANGWIVT